MSGKRRSPRTISQTTNYRLFKISEENRELDLQKHGRLKKVMQEYGYLWPFPIVCVRDENKELVVKDGQHRLALAEELGLPVAYVVSDVDFDIAKVNCTAKLWTLRDYAVKHVANGLQDYEDGLNFCEAYSLPISIGFALLAGTTTFGNTGDAFRSGQFKIKDRAWAEIVAGIYSALSEMAKEIKNARFTEACMAVCRVDEFDPKRLIQGAKRCREKLVSYSTRDAYLAMLEEVYNFGRRSQVPLKFMAVEAMKSRNPSTKASV